MKLKNIRHEKFAQGVASGKTATQACIDAGFSKATAGPAAARLLKNVSISTRIEELRGKAEAKMEFTREQYLATLRERFLTLMPNDGTTAKYGEMLAKAMGWNEPDKIDLDGVMDINIRIGGN